MDTDIKKFFTEAHWRSYEQGKAEGRAEAKAVAIADAVLIILRRRGVAITSDHEQRIAACTDLVVVDRWLDQAFSVSSADELFA